MARRDTPCTKEEFDNPNLIDDRYDHVFIDEIEMTAQNIWNYEGDRNVLVDKLVEHFYKEGFVHQTDIGEDDIPNQLRKLKDKSSNEAIAETGQLKNSSSLCLDVCRHFCSESFYNVRVNGLPSIREVYKDKELLKKILQNRMGWYTSTETIKRKGKNIVGLHPYLFDISHKMIVQGAHSSMTSGNVSNFRPLVAKFLYEKYCKDGKVILDLSAGWGARFLAAWSLNKTYYGIDPMTASEIDQARKFINSNIALRNGASQASKLIDGVSEDVSSYVEIPAVDYVIACPPYFKLEEYKCEKNSTDVYSEYQDWLQKYWKKTVENAFQKMKDRARFTLIMIQKWHKFNLLDDMCNIMEEAGLVKVDEMSYKTTRSHLTDKRETGNANKDTEKVVTFEKV